MLGFFNLLISWSFYALFFLVPLTFTGNTSELFEFNKMWLTFGLTLLIAVSWISKMFVERQIKVRRTILDIPILLFLFSQILSTIFSIDVHTSLWGYYSRFNGGLYSLLSYAFLYFAFVSNISPKRIIRYIYVGLISGVAVALWGLPSHFGYDPTCLIFRGTFDVSCWTDAFQPKVRIFSTLGQPDWLAAYLVYLLPISAALGIIFAKWKNRILSWTFLGMTALFYIDLLYTKARSGFAAFVVSIGIFILVYIFFSWRSFARHKIIKAIQAHWSFLIILAVFAVGTFLIGAPVSQLDRFTLTGVETFLSVKHVTPQIPAPKPASVPAPLIPVQEFGGTDSGTIRLFVWEGALQVFLHYPIFGTGVETFAYSYYLYRPQGHNLTSEWDYLYNKAHNEYLNYLATTGILGITTYLVVIGFTLWLMIKGLLMTKNEDEEEEKQNKNNFLASPFANRYLLLSLLTGYISILVTNFFGFSVVVMNIYLFLTPAFVLFIMHKETKEKFYLIPENVEPSKRISEIVRITIILFWLIFAYLIFILIRYWMADVSYALGQNLDHANEYQAAYSYLRNAVTIRPSEPVFQDELSVNESVLATLFYQQKDPADGDKLKQDAIAISDSLVQKHPAVLTLWKSRVRIFYALASVDGSYAQTALQAIEKAHTLAPTDAKISYNLGLLEGQTGDIDAGIATLKNTIKLKGDYRDAYYALALFYRQKALGNGKTVVAPNAEKQAVDEMHFILKNMSPTDDLHIKDTLKSWGES